jgi:hypothetical protein
LDAIAKDNNQPRIQLAGTLDGMEMSHQVCVVTAGIKILDPRDIDPVCHLPIGMEGSKKVQSCELCFPFMFVLSRATKTLYHEQFKEFVNFWGWIRPIEVFSPQDMSSTWKALGLGGGCKVHTLSSTIIVVHRHRMSQQCQGRSLHYESCITKNHLKCYHHATGDVATLGRLSTDLKEFQETHPFLSGNITLLLSKLQTHLDPSQFEKVSDPSNIEFTADSDQSKRYHYLQYLKPDLVLLGLSLSWDPTILELTGSVLPLNS